MSFSLIAFGAVNQASSSALAYLPPIPDQIYRLTGNGIIVPPDLPFLAGVFSSLPTGARLQVITPTLRRVFVLEVVPMAPLAVAAGKPAVYRLFSRAPLPLSRNEELDIQIANGAEEDDYAAVLVADGPIRAVAAPVFTARFTSATTCTQGAWTLCALTSDQGVQPGTYDVVGARCRSAHGVFFRLSFPNQVARPGGLCVQSPLIEGPIEQRGGANLENNLGVWGRFDFNALPALEIIADATDTAETVELDLVYHPQAIG